MKLLSNIHKINKINKVKKQSYDLIIKNNHNFFANNFLIHNSGYRGNIIGAVKNVSNEDYVVEKGTRLFQICQKTYEPFSFKLVDNLSDTTRGSGGFGSTGK